MAESIAIWQEDPGEPGTSGRTTRASMRQRLDSGSLALTVTPEPSAGDAEVRAWEDLRYWTAVHTIERSRAMWLAAMGRPAGLAWLPGASLNVELAAGTELNAYYDRAGLQFHVASVVEMHTGNVVRIATGESPDIVAHELGHAVLDVIQPDLWDANFTETSAFHEAFGDISAILTAVELNEVADELAALASSSVFVSTRMTRIGEQMGWGLRQTRPDLPDPNCLRDAVSSYFYVRPETLPTSAPSSMLSSEPHNFARVFTAAFMRVLDEMMKVDVGPDGTRTRAIVRRVARTAASLLVAAVRQAPVVDAYYHAVALAMIGAAQGRARARYRKAIATAFVRTGIVTVAEAAEADQRQPAAAGPARRGGGRRGVAPEAAPLRPPIEPHRMNLAAFGIDREVHLDLGAAPTNAQRRRGVVPLTADDTGINVTSLGAAHYFVEDLFRRNRLDLSGADGEAVPMQNPRMVTHRFDLVGEVLQIRRVRVDCGFDIS